MRTFVTAVFKAKAGSEAEVERIFSGMVRPTHERDQGCITYALHRSQDDPRTFVFMEEWESRELLDAHLVKDHIMEGLAALEGHLDARDIMILERIEGGDVEG